MCAAAASACAVGSTTRSMRAQASSVEVQCLGRVPTVSVDKVDGCQIYLGADALGAEILTAKSSEVNVVEVPAEAEEAGEPSEHPVPEQFVTKRGAAWRWVTVPVDHF